MNCFCQVGVSNWFSPCQARHLLITYNEPVMSNLDSRYEFSILHEPAFAQPGGTTGGAALVARMQAETLSNRGKEVRVISPKPNGDAIHPTIPHEFFDKPEVPNEQLLQEFQSDRWTDYFHDMFGGCRVGAVYAHYFVAGGIMADFKSNGLGHVPFIYMGHSWDRVVRTMDGDRSMSPLRSQAEFNILERADALIVATNAERRLLASKYGNDFSRGEYGILEKTHVVPLGVDKKIFNPANIERLRRERRTSLVPDEIRDSLNFFILGRISPQKRQLEAVEAFSEVAKDPALNISLSIFGGPLTGDYYKEIKDYVNGQPAEVRERVLFHGVHPAEVAIAAGDVFLGPSSWETWFLALTEAAASGKPTIVSDKPILREVAGEGSLYVGDRDINSIAQAIHKMATDFRFRQYSASYNAYRAAEYTWQNSASMLESVLEGSYDKRPANSGMLQVKH